MTASAGTPDPMPGRDDEELAAATLESLAAGQRLGDEAVVLILRVMTRMRAHPAIAQSPDLDDAVIAMASEFIVTKAAALSDDLAAKGPRLSPGSAIALLVTYVTNWLNDEWRKTAFGSVEHRLSQVLSKEPKFEQVASGTWFLTGATPGHWDGNEDDLAAAAFGVPADVPKWTSTTRRPPLAANASLVAVLVAILSRADAPLSIAVLTRVCLARFPHADDPTEVGFEDGFDRLDEDRSVEDEAIDAAGAPAAFAEAWTLVSTLSPDEVFILQNWTDLTKIGAHLGLGRSQASERRRQLKEYLTAEVGAYTNPVAVERALPDAFRKWTGKEMST